MHIVADVGATKMRIARAIDASTFDLENLVVLPTPPAYEAGVALFVEHMRKLARGEFIEAVAIGLPGILSRDKRTFVNAPNLPQWNGHALADALESELHTRLYLENDTAQVGLGEAVYGAGQGSMIMAYITVSTGVNGVRIVNSMIDRATFGFEIGDQFVCVEGEARRLQDVISGTCISQQYGMNPRDLGADSPVWEELAQILAYALNNTIMHWSPDRIVLGGSMFNEIGISIDRVRARLTPLLSRFPEVPEFAHSSLGDLGGLYGGLVRLEQIKS